MSTASAFCPDFIRLTRGVIAVRFPLTLAHYPPRPFCGLSLKGNRGAAPNVVGAN